MGALAGGIKSNEASTTLIMVDNRSGVQLAAAEGSANNIDFNLFGAAFGGGLGAGAGGYTNSPEGKLIMAAFADSYNQLVRAVRNYSAQTVKGGLGTGGALGVSGRLDGGFAGNRSRGTAQALRRLRHATPRTAWRAASSACPNDALLPFVGVGVERLEHLALDARPSTRRRPPDGSRAIGRRAARSSPRSSGCVPNSSAMPVYSACAHSSIAASHISPDSSAELDEPS